VSTPQPLSGTSANPVARAAGRATAGVVVLWLPAIIVVALSRSLTVPALVLGLAVIAAAAVALALGIVGLVQSGRRGGRASAIRSVVRSGAVLVALLVLSAMVVPFLVHLPS
jgi:hypothetical protein